MSIKIPNADCQSNAISECEIYLKEEKNTNLSKNIWPSDNKIIDLLLARRLELVTFYQEIYFKLEPSEWKRVLSIVVYTAAHWSPEDSARTREAISKVSQLNASIEKHARKLSELVQSREQVSEKYGLHSYEKYHVAEIIDDASTHNGHYQSYLAEPINILKCKYDLKYWPSVSNVIDIIADDAQNSGVYVTDSVTQASISGPRNSLANYVKVFYEALGEEKESTHQLVPDSFTLSDDSLASVINCALNFSDDDLIDSHYIKRARQRIREQEASAIIEV